MTAGGLTRRGRGLHLDRGINHAETPRNATQNPRWIRRSFNWCRKGEKMPALKNQTVHIDGGDPLT